MVLKETTPRVGVVSVSYPNFLDWRAQNHTFSEMAVLEEVGFNLSGVTAGYIFRRRLPTALFEPIQPVLRQRVFTTKETVAQVRNYFQSFFGVSNIVEENPGIAHLTAREQDILSHVSKGYLDKEIADALNISIWTVHNHLKHIYEKLDVHTRTEAVLKYLQK